ncbi:MAG: hypothetical protein V1744_07880 [Candidatus Altiarchaeota archaeon]
MVGLFSKLVDIVRRSRYVSSRNSEDHLYHRIGCECHYRQSITRENRLYFKSRNAAEKVGLRMCRICKHKSHQRKLKEYT